MISCVKWRKQKQVWTVFFENKPNSTKPKTLIQGGVTVRQSSKIIINNNNNNNNNNNKEQKEQKRQTTKTNNKDKQQRIREKEIRKDQRVKCVILLQH